MASISVLICTMNRPDELQLALQSLLACVPVPDEVIVSDDSPVSDRGSAEVCKSFNSIKYQAGPRRGLSANRNACVAASTGRWLHFIDDDVIVPPNFYADAAKYLNRLDMKKILTGSEQKYCESRDADPILVVPPKSGFWAHMESAGSSDGNCVVMNAALFPRSLFNQALFDERLKYGCEEMDISRHAIALGYKITFESSLVVAHYPSLGNRSTYDQWSIASALYAGLKQQWAYRRSVLGVVAFALIAIPRVWVNNFLANGFRSMPRLARQTADAIRYFVNYLHTRSDQLAH